MAELSIIENDMKTLEEKIDHWFLKHFVAAAPGSETHTTINKAHQELKAIVGIAPAAATTASAT